MSGSNANRQVPTLPMSKLQQAVLSNALGQPLGTIDPIVPQQLVTCQDRSFVMVLVGSGVHSSIS